MSSHNFSLEREKLMESLLDEMRKMSTTTVLMHQIIAERLGLNYTDHKCLDFIMRRESITAGQLAELTGLTTGAVTGVIDRLEKAGYVRRVMDQKDRRRIYIQPVQEKALNEIKSLFMTIGESTTQMCAKYSDEELRLILDFITRTVELGESEAARLRSEMKKG